MPPISERRYPKVQFVPRPELAHLVEGVQATEVLPVIVEGPAGAGKSFLLAKLEQHLATVYPAVRLAFEEPLQSWESAAYVLHRLIEDIESRDAAAWLKPWAKEARERLKGVSALGFGAEFDLSARRDASYEGVMAVFEKSLEDLGRRSDVRLVLIFDDYHKVERSREIPAMVRRLARFTAAQGCASFIVAGRGGLHQQLEQEDLSHRFCPVGLFEPRQTRSFLELNLPALARQPGFDAFCDAVQVKLHGHPYALSRLVPLAAAGADLKALVASLQGQTWEDVCQYLDRHLMDYLKGLDPSLASLLVDCFLLPSLEVEACAHLTGEALPASLLARLDDLRVVERTGQGRYQLHDLFRDYLASRVAKGRQAEQRAKAAHYYEGAARRLEETKGPPAAIAEAALLALDFLRQIRAHDRFVTLINETIESLHTVGHWGKGMKFLEEARSYRPRDPRTLHHLGIAHHLQGRYPEALKLYEESLALERELGNRRGVAQSLHQMGNLEYLQGRYPQALALYQESLALERELGDRRGVAQTLHQMGIVAYLQGRYPEALALYQESLDIERELGDRLGVAQTLHQMGMLHQDQGRYPEALKLYEESLALERELGDRRGEAQTLHQMGILHQLQGRYPEALALYQESLDTKRELGDRLGVAQTLGQMGKLYMAQGHLDQALPPLARALAIFHQLSSPYQGLARRDLADLKRQMGARRFKAALTELGAEGEECLRLLREGK